MTEGVVVDSEHYDMIIATAEAVKHISRTVDMLAARECPCDAVKDLQKSTTFTAGKIAGIITAAGFAANYLLGRG